MATAATILPLTNIRPLSREQWAVGRAHIRESSSAQRSPGHNIIGQCSRTLLMFCVGEHHHRTCTYELYTGWVLGSAHCPLAMANNPIDNSIVPNECPEHIPHSSELTPQSHNVIAIRVHPSLWFTGHDSNACTPLFLANPN